MDITVVHKYDLWTQPPRSEVTVGSEQKTQKMAQESVQKVLQSREEHQHQQEQQALAMPQQDGDESALGSNIQAATARED